MKGPPGASPRKGPGKAGTGVWLCSADFPDGGTRKVSFPSSGDRLAEGGTWTGRQPCAWTWAVCGTPAAALAPAGPQATATASHVAGGEAGAVPALGFSAIPAPPLLSCVALASPSSPLGL